MQLAPYFKESMYSYHAYGFDISSDMYFPELQSRTVFDAPDSRISDRHITIACDSVSPDGLPSSSDRGLYYQTAPGRFWLHVPDIARYEVKNGQSIRYQPVVGADEQSVRLFLLGSCLGALLHQQGLLVMHGAAIRFNDRCVLFAGPSGNGKSTLAAAFCKRGFEVLSDDVCAVDEQLRAVPGYPQIKLWRDATARLDMDTDFMRQIRLQVEKYAFKPEKLFCTRALPLVAAYFLSTHNLKTFEFEDLAGMKTFNPLRNNTYRIRYLKGMGLESEHLARIGALSRQVGVTRITRPNSGFRLEELVDHILEDLAEKGVRP